MAADLIEDLKRAVGFGESDAKSLAELQVLLAPSLPAIVDLFYKSILEHPGTRRTLTGGNAQLRRLRQSLFAWLRELFCGVYDRRYAEQHMVIGRTHVRVGLQQHYMFSAMNLLRLALAKKIEDLGSPNTAQYFAALHKILDIELAIMNDAYHQDMVRLTEETEHARYKQQLSESEHLATVGQLAASLAHEIKNPLAGISGAIQVLGAGLDDDHPHKEIITEALRQIDRLDAAVKDLLIYSRPKPPARSLVDFDQVLERGLILFRQEPAFRDVRVRCEGLNGRHQAEVDESQMQQVLGNLLLNAAQACDPGGDICCRISGDEASLRIVVEDNGFGMPPEVRARVFEPFFTTKSRGTGLGLCICERIVEAHGGTIHIDSEAGKGTRVTIQIPTKP